MIFTGFGEIAELNARRIIRRVRSADQKNSPLKKIYITFDDGPDVLGTPAVLDVLNRHQARATFFVVAEKAECQRGLIARTQSEGHAIGNHSLNHAYKIFFAQNREIGTWITQADEFLAQAGVKESVGFRPPAGICTPPLFAALAKRNEPLILWSHRFFDTTLAWTEKRMREALPRLRDGDIVLLHDRQKPARLDDFVSTLNLFIAESLRLGFQCEQLTRELCLEQTRLAFSST